mgnify:CR=1 FL=1
MMTGQQQERRLQWEKRIAEYRSSGQSVREWCAANGLDPNRLWYWLRRTRTEDAEPQATRWLPVEVTGRADGGGQAAGLLVRVGKAGIEVRPGFDPELLVAVVRALSEAC